MACIKYSVLETKCTNIFLFYHVMLCLNVILNLKNYRYYTGYPKDLGPSRIIPFTSERQFVQLLHEGRPVVVAFTIKYSNSAVFCSETPTRIANPHI